jgi:hypothetical protein
MACGWRAGGVRVACGWRAGGVRVVCGWCTGGVRVVCGWCAGGVRVVCGWCAGGGGLETVGGVRVVRGRPPISPPNQCNHPSINAWTGQSWSCLGGRLWRGLWLGRRFQLFDGQRQLWVIASEKKPLRRGLQRHGVQPVQDRHVVSRVHGQRPIVCPGGDGGGRWGRTPRMRACGAEVGVESKTVEEVTR